ncbi:MAG: type II/IV secretion system protein [Verrucomicrobia bacterium]|nr:type II/IV secretion system protein [Verrucomicrobiota bacterium]
MNTELAAPELLTALIRQADQAGASDIHLQMTSGGAQVAFRLDGVMTPMGVLPVEVAERVFGRIKFLARLKTYQESLPQDGRIGPADSGTAHDLRVATYPTVTGEKIVLRLFTQTAAHSLGELGLPVAVVDELEGFLRQQSGLLLLTGPAGSGKTTTIYACLKFLAELGGRHVITIEDPVEQMVPGIMQTEVHEARGLTFAVAARHLLRQDPQTLVLGEIRDDETAGLAVRAALTGHLVISTLHAGSCRGVFERLLVMCPDRYAVVAAVELVLNQRLIRRRCPACAGPACERCLGTGYRGRVPVVEWLRVSPGLRARVRARGADQVQAQGTLAQSAREVLERDWSDATELERCLGRDWLPAAPG